MGNVGPSNGSASDIDRPAGAAPAGSPRLSIPGFAIWLGLSAWAFEYAVLAFKRFVLGDRVVFYQESMLLAVFVYAGLFLVVGSIAATVARRAPGSRRTVLRGLVAVAAFCALLVFTGMHRIALLILAIGLGIQLGAVIARREDRVRRLVGRTLAPMAGAALVAVIAIATVEPLRTWRSYATLPAASAGMPNVILIILDTVRSRELGLYGHPRPTTPELEAFAANGTTFDMAIAPAPWTLPSHFSILTGLYPDEMPFAMRTEVRPPMPAGTVYLADVLRERGYRTAGFVANMSYTTDESGINRGFAHWDDHGLTPGQAAISTALGRTIVNNGRFRNLLDWYEIPIRKPARRVNEPMLEWIDKHDDRPYFVLANYFDAHDPYLPPPEFADRFAKERPTGAADYHPHLSTRWTLSGNTERELRAQRDMYNGSIAWLDSELGRLFDALDARGELENTVVIVTSDHGEAFEEHGRLGHGGKLHMEMIRVPLVISFPGRVTAGQRVTHPVTLVDLPATILDLLGITEHPMPGNSLLSAWPDAESGVQESAILSFGGGDDPLASIIADGWHYIRDDDSGREELYDLAADPLEMENLAEAPAFAPRLTMMHAALDSAVAVTPAERVASRRNRTSTVAGPAGGSGER